MRVSMFVTCFNDTLFPQTGRAVVPLLERVGCAVDLLNRVEGVHGPRTLDAVLVGA